MVFRTTSPAKVTQADLYADEVNDDSNRQTIIRSFESKENYTMEYTKNRIIILQIFFFQIIDESTRFAFRKLDYLRNPAIIDYPARSAIDVAWTSQLERFCHGVVLLESVIER